MKKYSMEMGKFILFVSVPLTVLVVLVSLTGVFTPDFYHQETLNWQAQSVGQDLINLVVISPVLLISAFMSFKGKTIAKLIWGGTVLYLTYTFLLYCFDVHFNQLFLWYCWCLGLSFYSSVLLFHYTHTWKVEITNPMSVRTIVIFFFIISILFYGLWLAEVIPAMEQGGTPKSVQDAGLLTNGVHVIDLAIFLPAIFVTALLMLKSNMIGLVLAPMLLTFFILMNITIGSLNVIMNIKGVASNDTLTIIMILLTLVSTVFLVWYVRSIKILLPLAPRIQTEATG